MKYDEQPNFKQNDFKVGDLIKCYDSCTNSRHIHEIHKVIQDYVEIQTEDFSNGIEVHFSCCILLLPKKARTFYIKTKDLNRIAEKSEQYILVSDLPFSNSENTKFIEVLE